MMGSVERVGARGKNTGVDLSRGTVDGSAQVILGVGMAAGKAGAALAQHGGDSRSGCVGLQEFSRYPFVGDAPVSGWIALQEVQPVQASLIQGS